MTWNVIRWTALTLLVTAGISFADMDAKTKETAEKAASLWMELRRLDIDGKEFRDTRVELEELIATMDDQQKAAAAAAMMLNDAPDAINAAALEMFGTAGVPTSVLKSIVILPARYQDKFNQYWPQRQLVRTSYTFLRPEYGQRIPENRRLEMITILAEHLNALAKEKTVTYGEQRLVSHMIQSVLSRYAGQQEDQPAFATLLTAMQNYVKTPRPGDGLAASIQRWLKLNGLSEVKFDSVDSALLGLGHWDPLVRLKAEAYLGNAIRKDPAVAEKVMTLLEDPQDEVRGGVAGVFRFALSYQPEVVAPRMVLLLVEDKGVTVQKEAADTLINHSAQSADIARRLMDALENRSVRPGPKRTTQILSVLSYLTTPESSDEQKSRLLKIAIKNMDYAPMGSLRAMESLGAFAKPAVNVILKYRNDSADRFTRQYIDRHVLPVIDPTAVPKKTPA